MAKDYARTKALEALEATGNNRREASMLMRVWAETDEKLKTALVGPFLNNLCALAVQRAIPIISSRRNPASKRSRPKDNASSLLQAISKGDAQTMSSTRNTAPPPRAGSARHKQAVSLLAAAFKTSRKF